MNAGREAGAHSPDKRADRIYLRLLRHTLPYSRTFALAIAAMVLLAATEPAIPALLQKVVAGFEKHDVSGVPLLAGLLIALFVVRGGCTFASQVLLAAVAGHLVMDLRTLMFDRLLTVPARFYDERQSGALISKVTFDAAQVTEAATHVVTVVVRDSLAILGLLGLMLWLNWQLTLIAVSVAPVVVLVVRYFSARLRRTSQGLQDTMGEVTHVVEEAIGGQRVVRTFGAQDYERGRLRAAVNRARQLGVKFQAAASGNAPLAQFVTSLALALILVFAARQFEAGEIDIASFVSFFTAMGMLFSPLKRLTGVNGRLQKGIAAADSVFDLIDQPVETDTGTRTIERAEGRLHFENVSFVYPTSEARALHGIDLEIQPGETLALVGPSGSGKTTMANLIPRFYEPSVGRIVLDGIDLRELTLESLRQNIALVSQEVVLFNDSVAANIAYGRQHEYSTAEIEAAAQAAHALEFIRALPDGFDTGIGERGLRLSGGQRQRLALARAFLKNAPLLILDEATSALDNDAERHIQSAVDSLRQGRTVIVIAHRLSSVERADRIAVLEGGRIQDIGTHHWLLEHNRLYAGLYRFQFSRHPQDRPAVGAR